MLRFTLDGCTPAAVYGLGLHQSSRGTRPSYLFSVSGGVCSCVVGSCDANKAKELKKRYEPNVVVGDVKDKVVPYVSLDITCMLRRGSDRTQRSN